MLVNPSYEKVKHQDPLFPTGNALPSTTPKDPQPMPREVNCNNFRGLIPYLLNRYGNDGLQTVLADLTNNPRYLVADKFDPSHFVPVTEEHLLDPAYWVSYEFAVRLFGNLKKVVQDPDPLFNAGLGAVKETLSKSVLFAIRILGPGLLFRQAQKFNDRFNRTKQLVLVELGHDFALLQANYYPGFDASKDICNWLRGMYTGVLRLAGFKEVKVYELKCRAQGDEYCLFRLTWKKESLLALILKGIVKKSLKWAVGDLVAEYEASVHERDKLIEKLTESEQRYRSVFENTATPTIIVEEDLTISMANVEFEKLSGYTKNQIEGSLTLSTFLPKEAIEIVLKPDADDTTANDDLAKREFQFTDKHGSHRDVLIKVGLIPGTKKYVCSFVDITSRKRMENALRKSEEKHRTIIKSIEEGYFETDLSGRFTFANDALCRIFGKKRSELIGMSYKRFVTPKTAKAIYNTFNKVYKTNKPVKVAEYEFFRDDGTKLIIGLSASLIKDQTEKPIGFRGMLRDVTEREKAKEEKRKLEARLEQAKRMEAIGTLAGGVAHDLNNILSGVVSYPELLLMQLPPDHPMRKPLTTIQQTGEKAATIVQDLLTLARRGVAVNEVLNLNKIISNYLESPEFEKLKVHHPLVEVITRLERGLLNIKGSPVHLSKTVMNLVSNAAEAMPDGGTIVISTENRYLEKPIAGTDVREGEYVVLTVSDTGVGMTAEEKERIFEPFYTKKIMGRSGTGLGMAVVWGTIQDHNGYIQVESTKGKGSTFTLYFPATREKIAEKEKHLSIEDYMGQGETVLVVDDVKEQREIAAEILKRLNYRVTTVSSGEEAVSYMKNHTSDVVLLDMIMEPGMDGLETYKKILEFRPEQRAVIVSGFSESDRVKEAQRLGAGPYVRKPYSLENIGVALRETLEKSHHKPNS